MHLNVCLLPLRNQGSVHRPKEARLSDQLIEQPSPVDELSRRIKLLDDTLVEDDDSVTIENCVDAMCNCNAC